MATANAKSIDITFKGPKTTYILDANIPEQKEEIPEHGFSLRQYCKQLTIENVGKKPIRHLFPSVNKDSLFTLKDIADKIEMSPYPLLSLFHIWNNAVGRVDTLQDFQYHPLDLLKFKGACSPKEFTDGFIKLCSAMGIETRLTNVYEKELYDFYIDNEWIFFDPETHQFYLGLDNTRLASSEDVMDDPLLILRHKHSSFSNGINFAENAKRVASFDILQQDSGFHSFIDPGIMIRKEDGYTLYPGETLLYENPSPSNDLKPYECAIQHHMNLEKRGVDSSFRDFSFPVRSIRTFKYHSPIPLRSIANQTESAITLEGIVELLPGQTYNFDGDNLEVTITYSMHPKGRVVFKGICSWKCFPALKSGKNVISLGSRKKDSSVRFVYEVDENIENKNISSPKTANEWETFNFVAPKFDLQTIDKKFEKIWWQIASDSAFSFIPSALDQVEAYTSSVTLSLIQQTYLSPNTTYYFRIKGYADGEWSKWSETCQFYIKKPEAVEEVIFSQLDGDIYELNWVRYSEKKSDAIDYLVYGSNSLDFIPSIYCQKQVNAISRTGIIDEEDVDNLVAITHDRKIQVDGRFAYYRIITRKHGQLSLPSRLIHVYDSDLVQPRNILQISEDDDLVYAKRKLIPSNYSEKNIAHPLITQNNRFRDKIVELQSLVNSKNIKRQPREYEYPDVSDEIWEEVAPYLLPDNHPAWPKLNRVFCASRATQTPEHFKKAGFRRWHTSRFSRVSASSHHAFEEYFIKAYCDIELGIIYDWKKWIHRILGAECIRESIKRNKLHSHFKVPQKWIYPLPKKPAPPNNAHFARKNFILVCENMFIESHESNEKMYKKKFNRKLMYGLYTILQECGLYDSVYVFNMPFCKDGRIAFIDTEYHHKWPVPFFKLDGKFSKELIPYWKRITHKGGDIPDGENIHNPPRMDRRDVKK